MELIFGLDCIKAALSANRRQIFKLLVYYNEETMKSSKNELSQIIDSAQLRKVPIQFTTRSELDSLLDKRPHQNVALSVSKFEPPVLTSPMEVDATTPTTTTTTTTSPRYPSITVFPVNLLDPQNLGSIIRTAAFYSCAGLVTSLKNSCDFTPIVSKASAGCMEIFQNMYRTKSPLQFLTNAKNQGYKIIGTGLAQPSVASSPSNLDKCILLLGNEGSGLSPQILELCDFNLKINQQRDQENKFLDSLNVSVATGILLDRLLHFRS